MPARGARADLELPAVPIANVTDLIELLARHD
jgi:hypothetical protein